MRLVIQICQKGWTDSILFDEDVSPLLVKTICNVQFFSVFSKFPKYLKTFQNFYNSMSVAYNISNAYVFC